LTFVIEVIVATVGFIAIYLTAIALADSRHLLPMLILYAMRGVEYAVFIADLAGFRYFLWTGTVAFIRELRATV
jgi:hypothetical protein